MRPQPMRRAVPRRSLTVLPWPPQISPRHPCPASNPAWNHGTTVTVRRSTIVVPVYDEEADLGPGVRRLHAYLTERFPFTWRITIADNASKDRTPLVAAALAVELPGVRVVRLEEKGRGRALRTVWSASDAEVLAYMDVDLSTDLDALLPLVAPLISGHSDLAIGSRLARSARVVRGPKREIISRGYNRLLRLALQVRFSDAQCGFKAVRADRARALLPLVRDSGWFFDTELLVLAERTGLRIHEVPVDWVDDPDSRVDIVATAVADLKGVWRLGRDLTTGQLPVADLRRQMRRPERTPSATFAGQAVRFATVGVASTVAYLLLYLLLRTRAAGRGRRTRSPCSSPRWPTPPRTAGSPSTSPARTARCATTCTASPCSAPAWRSAPRP